VQLLKTLRTFSNLQAGAGYGLRSFDLTPFRGQTVRIELSSKQSEATIQRDSSRRNGVRRARIAGASLTHPPRADRVVPEPSTSVAGLAVAASASRSMIEVVKTESCFVAWLGALRQ
jgi:hypothetical protein